MTATEPRPATTDRTALLDLNVLMAPSLAPTHSPRPNVGSWFGQLAACRLATAGQVTDFHLLALARATQSLLVTMDQAIPTYLGKFDKNLAELLS